MENSNPLRNLRCHHCAGPLSKEMEASEWTVAPLVRDSFSMIGSAVGGTTSAFYGFNHVMPIVRRYVKGPMWVHFLVGTTCDSILLSLCRVGRWCCSSPSSISFFVIPCCILVFFFFIASIFTG
uniref:Uncharacterized protein n=1 Tax=Gossypium raimondii TaxID=29730 RepID=A0A0D2PF79_GOSRA|nr:hypothetical protein B456_007G264600 [Gossypium raimondii]